MQLIFPHDALAHGGIPTDRHSSHVAFLTHDSLNLYLYLSTCMYYSAHVQVFPALDWMSLHRFLDIYNNRNFYNRVEVGCFKTV